MNRWCHARFEYRCGRSCFYHANGRTRRNVQCRLEKQFAARTGRGRLGTNVTCNESDVTLIWIQIRVENQYITFDQIVRNQKIKVCKRSDNRWNAGFSSKHKRVIRSGREKIRGQQSINEKEKHMAHAFL